MITLRVVEPEPVKLEVKNAVLDLNAPDVIDLTVAPSTTQQVFEHEGHDGYDKVTVQAAPLQSKNYTLTSRSATVSKDSGYYGMSDVNITANVPVDVATDLRSITSQLSEYTIDFPNAPNDITVSVLSLDNNKKFNVPQSSNIVRVVDSLEKVVTLGNVLRKSNRSIYFEDGIRLNLTYNDSGTGNFSNVKIYGEIEVVSCWYNSFYRILEGVTHVEMKENSMPTEIGINEAYWQNPNKSVLIELVNSLKDEGSTRNFSIDSSKRTTIEAIRGNSVLDTTETYHNFVEDENGEMNIVEFVTNVKRRSWSWV